MLLRGDKEYAAMMGEQEFTWYHDGKPYGYFMISRNTYIKGMFEYKYRYIYDLCIFEEKDRNKGLGNLMIKELTEQLGQYTKFPLRLKVLRDNKRALHLYKKYNFVIIAEDEFTYTMEYRKELIKNDL